jgi:hypothetical protein
MMMNPPKPKGLSEKEINDYKQNLIGQIADGKANQTQTAGLIRNGLKTTKLAIEQVEQGKPKTTEMTKEQFNYLLNEAKKALTANGYSYVYSSLLPNEFKLV